MQPLPRLFGRHRRYSDIDVSIHEHIQERADELEAEGIPRKQAEQTARHEFGNVALVQQRSREQWQWRTLESLVADLKFTLRRLRKVARIRRSRSCLRSPSASAPIRLSSASLMACS